MRILSAKILSCIGVLLALLASASVASAEVTVALERNGLAVAALEIAAVGANGVKTPGQSGPAVSFDDALFDQGKSVAVYLDEGADGISVLLAEDGVTPPPPAQGKTRRRLAVIVWTSGSRLVVDAGRNTVITQNQGGMPSAPGGVAGLIPEGLYPLIFFNGMFAGTNATSNACDVINADYQRGNYDQFTCGGDQSPAGWRLGGGVGWMGSQAGLEFRASDGDYGTITENTNGTRPAIAPAPALSFSQDASSSIKAAGFEGGLPIVILKPRSGRRLRSLTVTPFVGVKRFKNKYRIRNQLDAPGFNVVVNQFSEEREQKGWGREFGVRAAMPAGIAGVEVGISRATFGSAFPADNEAKFESDVVHTWRLLVGAVFKMPIRR